MLCPSNKEYKQLLLEWGLIKNLLSFLGAEASDYKLADVQAFLASQIEGLSYEQLYTLMLTVFAVFLKENQIGQSVYTQYVEETMCPIDQSGPLPDLEFDPISWKNGKLQDMLVDHFSLESEQFYHRTQFLVLFAHLETILGKMKELSPGEPEVLLWEARHAMIHNDILTSNVEKL